jgi:murein DD-endopeptidase MepM/ murein hydrolase activator NlpD
MRMLILIMLGTLAITPGLAQSSTLQGGPIAIDVMDDNHAEIDAAHRESVARAKALGLPSAFLPQAKAGTGNLQFPLRLRPFSKAFRGNGISNFVDLNPTSALKDYVCGTRTYNGHRGIDFLPYPYYWRMMDAAEMEVVAAAAGTIIHKADGSFDRQCSLNSQPSNFVVILQDDGLYAFYFHLRNNSLTKVAAGKRVAAGDYLGLVASSGNSTAPHLHFELRTATNGPSVDPFAGACGAAKTKWRHQPEDIDTDILRIATHAAVPPGPSTGCSNPDPMYSNKFAPGATVWGAVFLRDQRKTTPVQLSFIRPDGSVFASWTAAPASQLAPFAYWYGSIPLPAGGAAGLWKVRATIEGKSLEHAFTVGPGPGATNVDLTVNPLQKAATPQTPATFTASISNTGTNAAVGCVLAPDAPLAAVWNFRAAGQSTGEQNRVFDIAPGTTKKVALIIRPKAGYHATGARIPIRVICLNAKAPAARDGVNIVTLTF